MWGLLLGQAPAGEASPPLPDVFLPTEKQQLRVQRKEEAWEHQTTFEGKVAQWKLRAGHKVVLGSYWPPSLPIPGTIRSLQRTQYKKVGVE